MNEYYQIIFSSPSQHQDLYQKLFKCFSNYIPKNIIPNFVIREVTSDEIVYNKDSEKSETGKETHDSKEELKHPEEKDSGILILEDLNKKKRIILVCKQRSNDLDKIIYPFYYHSGLLRATLSNYPC